MRSRPARSERFGALLGIGAFAVLCCAVGLAAIGARAGSAIGGWLGSAIACVLGVAVALVLHLRPRRPGSGC